MKSACLVFLFFVVWQDVTLGDVYLHNPRGSNNRLNEASTARSNANRLFNSQNNNNGGYNVGDKTHAASSSEETQYNMAYFQSGKDHKLHSDLAGKSLYTIEWTNQHGCGDRDLNCNIVLQYKCQRDEKYHPLNVHSMRNGRQTHQSVYNYQVHVRRNNKNIRMRGDAASYYRGLHEPWEWHDKCRKRQRNHGLFTADQKLKGSTSVYTRQNAAGTRYGYECSEERDYYPYFHPTDWIDIAVFAQNTSFCQYYREESFNVKKKGECLQYYKVKTDGFKHDSVHNNKISCEKDNGIWVEFSNYLEEAPKYTTKNECKGASTRSNRLIWGIPYRSDEIDNLKMTDGSMESLHRCLVALDPPHCEKAPHTRTNHLGNARDVVPLHYKWVLPFFPSRKAQRCVLRIRYNISTADYEPFNTFSDQNNNPNAGVYSPVLNDPVVKVGYVQMPLQLAINTAQFGRTFQDRSHLFKLFPRPKHVSDDDIIHNLNVRGKRGNIVQVYPAVEYDFFPKRLHIYQTELVHIQWTGSNTNPSGNDGEGTARTDRNNMVEMAEPGVNYPLTSEKVLNMFKNADIVWTNDPATKTKQDIILSVASSGYYNSMSMCEAAPKKAALNTQLNNAPASYRGMLLRFKVGDYYYMCTRNNNFTNRNQKGRLRVHARKENAALEKAAPKKAAPKKAAPRKASAEARK